MVEHTSFFYRPNPCEVSRIKANEILKRRQIRMTQVRRISKVYSAIARNIYRETKRAQTGYENLLLQKQQMAEDFALLQTRQRMLDDIMEHFGHGHRNANSWKDPVVEERKRLSITRVIAKKRFAEAYADLLVTRARSLRNVEMRRHLRETVRVAERARAATIAALPPPSRDPLDAHLNPSGGPCSRCQSDAHKACHLVMDTNEPPLKYGNQELKETGEVKGGGVLGGPLRLEKDQFELNVHCIASSRVDDPVNPDALIIAVAKNECADFACQRAIPLASESGLSSRIHVQFATGRTQSKQEDELLMQQPKHISLSEAEIGHSTHIEDLSSSLGRPTLVTPDPKPLGYVQFHPYCTTLMDPHLVLRGQEPGEQTNLPSSALSPCQDFIAQPHPSTGPTSGDLRTLTFRKKPPVLPFAIPTNLKSHTSESIELPSTGTDALDASKLLVIRPHRTKISVSESCGISEMDNGRPSSTVLSEMVSFDCIKMQLDSEVENIDKAITELRESFSSSILSLQSTQDTEVNSIRICALSTSPNLATNHSGSPLKVVEVLERPEAMVKGAREYGTLHNAESCRSDSINNGIAMNAPSFSAGLSAEKDDERQSPGAASPTTSLSSSPISGSTAEACTSASAKPSTGARSLPVLESLQRRARELILRQMECIRAGDAGNHIPACGMLELPSHRLMGLAQENGADLEIPSVPAKTLVLKSLGSSHDLDDGASPILDTLPLTSCQSWAQPMISPASVLLSSLRRPSPPSSPLPSLPSSYTMPSSIATSVTNVDRITIPSKISFTSTQLLDPKEAENDGVDLFTETIGNFTARKRELLRSYLKRLLGTGKTSEVLPLNCSGTHLSPISASKICPINTLAPEFTETMSPVCSGKSEDNPSPQCASSSNKSLGSNPPDHLKWDASGLPSCSCFASDLHSKERFVSHLNESNPKVDYLPTSPLRFSSSSTSDLELSCGSSSGRPVNQLSVLSCKTQTSGDTERSIKSSASMRRKFAITESTSVALETTHQNSSVKRYLSQFEAVPSQVPDITNKCNIFDSSMGCQERKTAAIKTNLDADFDQLANKTVAENRLLPSALFQPCSDPEFQAHSTNSSNLSRFSSALNTTCRLTSSNLLSKPIPTYPTSPPTSVQNCIWFQKAKYSLQSIPTQLEDKVNSQVAFNSSVQTDSTPNSSSRPSNQFSYLSSQSSCLPAEAPLVSESEASQKHASCVPINQSTTPAGSASTTLRALRRGLSNGFKGGFKESHLQPFCDASVGTLNLEKSERLNRLRAEFVADEVFPSLCSDPSPIPTTNNTSSFLQQSSAFMNSAKEPSPSPLLNSQSLQVKAPFKVGMLQHPPSKSLSLDLDTSSTKRESERVLCSVDTSPISTLMRLQSESIPPTPVSDINKNLTLLTRSKLINPSKSLPIVAQFDDMEEIGTGSTMSAHGLKNPTLYSLLACCNIAGNCVAPSCNANVLSESTRKKCETESRNQSTETSCSACDSIDIGTSPSVSLHSFLENEACVQSPVEQKRDGEETFYKEETLTVHTDFLTVPSSSRGLVQQTRRSSYSPLALGRPLISIKLESLSTSSTLKDLARSDQKEGNEATTTSTLATLPVGNVEGGKSVSDAASPTILVCSKSVIAKASKLISDNMKIDMMNPVAVEPDARGSNSAKALVPDLVDAKVDDKAANTEEFACKSVSVNAGSEASVERKLTCAEPEDVETSDGLTGTVASIRAEAVDVIETGVESVSATKSEAVLTDVETVGPKSPVLKAFTVASLDVITPPTIELVGAKKRSVKAATREFLVSAPSAGATAGFVDLLSAETSSVELKSSGSTNVKMAVIKTFDKEVPGAAAVRAMNVAENVPIDFITTKLEGEFGINSTELEIPGVQSFGAKMSASEEIDQSEIVPEPTAFEMKITKSNALESHAAVSGGLRVNNPSLLAANPGSTRLTGTEVTDFEWNHDHAISHQPKRAAIYAAATPTDLPVYLIANTAATTARMRKVRDELEQNRLAPLPNSEPRLMAALQEELSVSATDLSSAQSPNREEVLRLNGGQNERNSLYVSE